LHISDGTSTGDVRVMLGDATNNVLLIRNGATDEWVRFTGGDGVVDVFSNKALIFRTNATERMRITNVGEVLVGGNVDNGAYNLQCNGTGVWGAGAYVNGSDARIKEDVAPIPDALPVIQKLNPVSFRYKESWSKDQAIQPGFIAQEVEVALEGTSYIDGIVQQGGNYMALAYQNFIPLLVKAIQELDAKVEAIEAQ
ncbi:MAG: tail fiber domain-containing protein, partial [Pseudomonadota bacterium]